MRLVLLKNLTVLMVAVLAIATPVFTQQAPDNFRWVDFHSAKDQDVAAWVARSLAVEDWTAIREIAVEYDAALVVTTKRATAQSPANEDGVTVWSASLVNHGVTRVLTGANLRWLDWMRFADGAPEELAVLYDSCRECAANTYFTAFHYDVTQHGWAARWMRGGQGAPLWSAGTQEGVNWTQVYAGLAEPNGRELIGTWNHFDYGSTKLPDEVIYRYDLDPANGRERIQLLSGKDAEAMKLRVCSAQDAMPGLGRGQDSALCQELLKPRKGRKPVTTPPGNNHGKSVPPGARH